jgi:transcriptional regulator with XRE-family HTH domain
MKPKKVPESLIDVDIKLKEIGQKLRMIRKTQYSNYEEFAQKCNINKVLINRSERGKNISMKQFVNIIQKLGISFEEFFKEL